MFEDLAHEHDNLGVAYRWAATLDNDVVFDTELAAVLASVEHVGVRYQVSVHASGDALVLSVGVKVVCDDTGELELLRELNTANAFWSFGAFVYTHQLSMIIHKDGLEPGTDDLLEEDDVMGLFECGVEAIQFLMQSMPDYFEVEQDCALRYMITIGRA